MIEALLKAGANARPKDKKGKTAVDHVKDNDVDVNTLEEKTHQPGHSLTGIKLPFDSEATG